MHSMTRFPLTPRMRAAITPVLLKRSLQHFEASMAADYARINGSMPCTCSAGLRASGGRNGSSTQQHVEGYGPRQLAALASAMPYLLRPSSQRNVVLWWELLKRRCEQVGDTTSIRLQARTCRPVYTDAAGEDLPASHPSFVAVMA